VLHFWIHENIHEHTITEIYLIEKENNEVNKNGCTRMLHDVQHTNYTQSVIDDDDDDV
jgi:hypothetical protein